MANKDINDIFGSDSEDDDGPSGAAGAGAAAAAATKKSDIDALFADSDSDDDEPAPAPKPKRLTKKRPKKADKPRLKKRPRTKEGERSKAGADGSAAAGGKEPDSEVKDGQTAYDSGSEVEENEEDRNFLASDDDEEELAAEYRKEKQVFNDVEGYDEDDEERPKKGKKSKKSSGSGPDKLSKADQEDLNNPIMQAVRATKRKRTKDMDESDKIVIVTTLLEKMDQAKRDDDEARQNGHPAQHKLKILGMVEKILGQRTLHESLLDYDVLEMLRDWLEPTPREDAQGREMPLARRTLPNLTLRSRLYKCLATMPITPEYLKNSERGGPGMGKIIMQLFKHPQETVDNKRVLQKLMEEWSRHIFKKTKDYKQLAQLEDPTGALDGMASQRRRQSVKRQDSTESVDDLLANSVGRAGARVERDSTSSRVVCPISDGFNFKIRPQANVQPAKEAGVGGRSGSEKKQALYKAIKSKSAPVHKNARAKTASIEGRGAHKI